jgi:alanine racemase
MHEGDARATISLDALASNYRRLAAHVNTPILAPVKANAYGHGAVPIARHLESLGVTYLAVATAYEALELRAGGVKAPILLLNPPPREKLAALVAAGITFTLFAAEQVPTLAAFGRQRVHLKVNTGLNRLGARPGDAGRLLREAERVGLEVEGVFTHLVDSEDAAPEHSPHQLGRFLSFLREHRPEVRYLHAANTGAILNPVLRPLLEEIGCNLSRPGIGLYGYSPGPDVTHVMALDPILTLTSWVTFVKQVHSGEVASYNATWKAPGERTLATVRYGYADGYPRSLSNRGVVVLGGEVRPIVGRVCMDQFLVDVTGAEVRVGDEVTILGPGKVTAETLADLAGTNSYEMLTSIAPRVERAYR